MTETTTNQTVKPSKFHPKDRKIRSKCLQAYLLYNNMPGATYAKLGQHFGVNQYTIAHWISEVKEQIDEVEILDAVKKRLRGMLPMAADVYNKALEQGCKGVNAVSASVAKDLLKDSGALVEKHTIEHEIKSLDDKDLEAELSKIVNRTATPNPYGKEQR